MTTMKTYRTALIAGSNRDYEFISRANVPQTLPDFGAERCSDEGARSEGIVCEENVCNPF